MTFVLPGGNAISPIIIFRLDDLIGNSQLVKGFSQTLPSLPLIQKQIDIQLNKISHGQLSDTDKDVGGEADAGGVQVIDHNTLQQALDGSFKYPEGFDSAISLDAHINQPSLLAPGIPTPPNRVFVDSPFLLPGNLYFTGQPFSGFIGKNVFFFNNNLGAFPGYRAPTLHVDLSPYAALPKFDIVAADTLNILGSVTFDGLSGGLNSIFFSLVGGEQILVAAGSNIRADVANFIWQSPGDLTFNSVTLNNDGGNTTFGRLGSSLTLNNSTFNTAASLTARVAGDITLNNSSLKGDTVLFTSLGGSLNFVSAGTTIASFGNFTADQSITVDNSYLGASSLFLNTKSGSVNLTRTAIRAQYLSVNSGDGILIDGGSQTFNVAGATLLAKNLATVRNADLSNIASLNMAADTVTIADSIFNPNNSYSIGTRTGQVNVNNGVNSGQFNLINDKLGTVAITSASQINMTGGASTAAGINSYVR